MKQKYFYYLLFCISSFFGYSQQASHLNFDGTNDFIVSASAVTNNTQNQTYQVWFRIPSIPVNSDRILQRGSDGTGGWSLQIDVTSTGRLSAGISATTDTFLTGTTILTPNTWYQATFVFENNNSLRLYLNGNLENSLTIGNRTLRNSDNRLRVGSGNIASEFFRGDVDEVRVWSTALSQTEIMNTMNCELQGSVSGLTTYYKFNQGIDQANNASETTALDATSSANNGTLTGFALNGSTSNWLTGSPINTPGNPSVTTPITYTQGDTASALTATTGTNGTGLSWYTTATGGTGSSSAPIPSTASVGSTSYWVSSTNANGCESARVEIVVTVNAPIPATHLNFDGSNDFVDLGNTLTSTLNGANFFTVEAWIFTPSVTGTKTIVGNHISNGAHFNLRIINDRLNGFLGFGAYDLNSAAGTIVANTWQHVAMVYNDTTLKLYIDGTEVASMAIPAAYSLQNTIQPYRIGASGYGGEFFNGNIDDVRIWNVVKTPDQLAASKNCELQGNETGLLRYYKLNQGFDAANNSAITSATDATANANNGTLTGFALNGATSNWLAGSPVTTGSLVPGNPSVTTPVTYNQGDSASALTATTGTNGTGLMWYTTATGGTGLTAAPTPSTATAGSTSYWVSSTNVNGCESERVEIVVNVNANATHLNFDGTNDSVVSANAITSNSGSQTYQAWFRIPSSVSTQKVILQRGIDGTGGWSVQLSINGSNRLQGGIVSTLSPIVSGTTTLVPNTWYHATLVIENNSVLRLYLNGVQEASATVGTLNLRNSDNRLRVGSGNIPTEFFNGDIDEVKIWNKVLSPTDIMNTMNCELANGETNLNVYYKLNQGFNNASNAGITTANDNSGNNNNGTLTGFALTGATSNWASGSAMTTGNTCSIILNSNDFETNNLVFYPNPTNGIINIDTKENVSVEIFDLLGKVIGTKVLNLGSNTIDITNYPSGVYLLKTTSNEGKTITTKIIKK